MSRRASLFLSFTSIVSCGIASIASNVVAEEPEVVAKAPATDGSSPKAESGEPSVVQASPSVEDQSREIPRPFSMRLWEGDAPGALGAEEKDIPKITIYRPLDSARATGAIVICPGGGYGHLAMDHEGKQIGEWATRMGMVGVVLDYRHQGKGYRHPSPLLDVQRAIRVTRAHAKEWNIAVNQVGVLGFSAGGHLASTLLTHFDAGNSEASEEAEKLSCRPDFGVICYPVIVMGEEITHRGSQKNLLGEDPSQEMLTLLSNDKQVSAETPPCFLWHTAEDKAVPPMNSIRFYQALLAKGVSAELHVFAKGRHGLGLAPKVEGANAWPDLCHTWLKELGFAPASDQ